MKIEKIIGREILDSRGNPTVEVDVIFETESESEAYNNLEKERCIHWRT